MSAGLTSARTEVAALLQAGRKPIATLALQRRARSALACTALMAAAAALLCVSVAVGEVALPLPQVFAALTGQADPSTMLIVRDFRLPRALTGALVGAALGLSGGIFQALVRNPLASPDIAGVTAGASAGAVLMIVAGGGSLAVPGGAIVGGLAATICVYLLAYRGGVTGYRLVLVGIGMSAVLGSLTGYLLTRAEIFDAQRAFVWLTGSLNGRGWEHVRPVGLALLVLLVPALLLGRHLRMLQLGDLPARGLGVRVELVKLLLIAVGVGLASVATAAAGPVAFVAFVSAPVARHIAGAGGPALIPSALAGAVLLLGADIVARVTFGELPVGVITGAIGAVALMLVLVKADRNAGR